MGGGQASARGFYRYLSAESSFGLGRVSWEDRRFLIWDAISLE
jgi:hypothetical protein